MAHPEGGRLFRRVGRGWEAFPEGSSWAGVGREFLLEGRYGSGGPPAGWETILNGQEGVGRVSRKDWKGREGFPERWEGSVGPLGEPEGVSRHSQMDGRGRKAHPDGRGLKALPKGLGGVGGPSQLPGGVVRGQKAALEGREGLVGRETLPERWEGSGRRERSEVPPAGPGEVGRPLLMAESVRRGWKALPEGRETLLDGRETLLDGRETLLDGREG